MSIEVVRTYDFTELERKLRSVPLMKKDEQGSEIFPYRHADIRLREFHVGEVNPPTFYLLKKNNEFQQSLRRTLCEQGYDSLRLTAQAASLELFNTETNEYWTLIPPIIESTVRTIRYVPFGDEIDYGHAPTTVTIQLICDGAHRVAMLRETGGMFAGISIVGSNPRHSYYAHPNGWDQVREVDEVPTTPEEKKYYRFKDCYALYRNFEDIGCGKPRGFGGS
ncbi:MAG: hypothetical protein AAB400_02165 [Patescibacteria group bacterium]